MTDVLTEVPAAAREAASRRKAAAAGKADGRRLGPNDGERARLVDSPAQLRAQVVERDGKQFHRMEGYASMVGRSYEMWDFFGPYMERVATGAFDATLAATPDVAFLINHTGLTLARTTNGTLELSADALGLRSTAWLNPQRDEARNLALAIDDKLVTEMSFAFMIDEASWNDDFTEFTIEKVNLNRGDVSAVNYGANPFTSIAARSQQIMRDVQQLPTGAARAALGLLRHRKDLNPAMVTRMTDATPQELVAAADQVVDQLEIVHDSGDHEGTAALITAVDEIIDSLMTALGVPDPDEMDPAMDPGMDPGMDPMMGDQMKTNSTTPPQTRAATGRSIAHVQALLDVY